MAPPRFNTGLPGGTVTCPDESFTVDGPSRQAPIYQQQLAQQPRFCPSPEHWIISADFGIHPSEDGHAQFAQALESLVAANDLLPPPPRR